MTLSKRHRRMVTEHAMVRYLERVEGHDLSDIREELSLNGTVSDTKILDIMDDRYGLTRDHIAHKTAPKIVCVAIEAGVSKVKIGNWVWIIENGVIATIEPRLDPVTRRSRSTRLRGTEKPRTESATRYQYHRGRKVALKGNHKKNVP